LWLGHKLSYDSKTSELPQSSTGIITKNIQTGGGEKKRDSLRLAVTLLDPRMHKLIQNKQEQISH